MDYCVLEAAQPRSSEAGLFGARSKLHGESSSVIVLLLHFHYHWGAAASIAATMCTAPQLRAAVLAVSAEDSVFSRPPRSQLVPLHCTLQFDSFC